MAFQFQRFCFCSFTFVIVWRVFSMSFLSLHANCQMHCVIRRMWMCGLSSVFLDLKHLKFRYAPNVNVKFIQLFLRIFLTWKQKRNIFSFAAWQQTQSYTRRSNCSDKVNMELNVYMNHLINDDDYGDDDNIHAHSAQHMMHAVSFLFDANVTIGIL